MRALAHLSGVAAAISVAAVSFASSGSAADFPTKVPTMYAATPFDWNGFYVGANVGYGWVHGTSDVFDLAGNLMGSREGRRSGVLGGGQFGFNWMFAPRWLAGLEADIDAANITGSSDGCITTAVTTNCSHIEGKSDWFSTLRGRFGYAVNDWLLYGTGGVIWVDTNAVSTITSSTAHPAAVGTVNSSSKVRAGWTAGGGVEWGFAPHWSARLEYLYFRVDTTTETSVARGEGRSNGDIVRLGVNYLFN